MAASAELLGRLPDERGIRESQASVEALIERERSRGIAACVIPQRGNGSLRASQAEGPSATRSSTPAFRASSAALRYFWTSWASALLIT